MCVHLYTNYWSPYFLHSEVSTIYQTLPLRRIRDCISDNKLIDKIVIKDKIPDYCSFIIKSHSISHGKTE
jgi:hypothetical protein